MPRNFGLWISISSPVFVGALSRHENIIDSFSMKILETMPDRFRGGQLVRTRRRRLIAVLEKWGTRGKFFFPPNGYAKNKKVGAGSSNFSYKVGAA